MCFSKFTEKYYLMTLISRQNEEEQSSFLTYIVVLFAFGAMFWNANWDPGLTLAIIPISLGMLIAIAIVIQLVLRESVQAKMKKILDSEIEERREELIKELKELVSYLEKTKYPSYSESGAEGLEEAFQEFDSNPNILFNLRLFILQFSLFCLH